MTPTDLSEQGLELKIVADLTGLTSAQIKAAQSAASIAIDPSRSSSTRRTAARADAPPPG